MSGERVQPLEIELERGEALRIRWTDGRRDTIALATLRKACPCAGCRAEREASGPVGLPVVADSERQRRMTVVEHAELVGLYALRVVWADGHDTGLYEYAMLRELGSPEE